MTDIYMMFLCGVDGLGRVQADALLDAFGTAEAVVKADELLLRMVPGVRQTIIDSIVSRRAKVDPEREYERISALGIGFSARGDSDFPSRLLEIEDGPNGLFYKGKLPNGHTPAIAIVGSRQCTNYGRDMSIKFASELASAGVDVISGMAVGVDGYSHRGALEHGETYAVLGTGVDVCFPEVNRDIYEIIPSRGGLLSEYYPGTRGRAQHFPRRNRIISGLSDGILVVEARERSGSWITVDIGLEQGREIFAIPGRLTDPLSFGCNRLIRQGGHLVMSPADIISELAPSYGFLVERPGCGDGPAMFGRKKSSRQLTKEEKKVLSKLDTRPHTIDDLATATGLDARETMAALTVLEIKGLCEMVGCSSYVKRII